MTSVNAITTIGTSKESQLELLRDVESHLARANELSRDPDNMSLAFGQLVRAVESTTKLLRSVLV